jgi:hyperosmotically inducible periplasmic protein
MKPRSVVSACIAVCSIAAAGIALAQGPGTASSAAASTSQAKLTDKQLAKKVRIAIRQAGGVDMAAVAIRARNGVITLAGSVPSTIEASKAADVAKGVSGVSSVKNKLSVQTEEN